MARGVVQAGQGPSSNRGHKPRSGLLRCWTWATSEQPGWVSVPRHLGLRQEPPVLDKHVAVPCGWGLFPTDGLAPGSPTAGGSVGFFPRSMFNQGIYPE